MEYARALYPVWAMDRIRTAASIGLALSGNDPPGPKLRETAIAEAYPVEVTEPDA